MLALFRKNNVSKAEEQKILQQAIEALNKLTDRYSDDIEIKEPWKITTLGGGSLQGVEITIAFKNSLLDKSHPFYQAMQQMGFNSASTGYEAKINFSLHYLEAIKMIPEIVQNNAPSFQHQN